MPNGPPPQRRPGHRDGFDRRPDPNADFLGQQSLSGGGSGLAWMVIDAVRRVVRGRRKND